MTTQSTILVDNKLGYRVITLNRPDKLNAFNDAMHEALRKAIEDAAADEDLAARSCSPAPAAPSAPART